MKRRAPTWPVVPHRLPGEGSDRVIAYVDLAVRDDPPVVPCPCDTPPARLSLRSGQAEGLHYAGALGVLLTGRLAGG
jgi:hypothetical protein